MGLASEIAVQRGSPMPMGEAAREIYSKIVEGRPELAVKDFSSVYRFLKESN
jgi:3-hydroxyisobutyrate dehydrogenase